MTIKVKGPYADARSLMQANGAGNLSGHVPSEDTLAALAQNEQHALGKIPAYSYVYGLMYAHAALGALTGLQFGYENEAGDSSDPDALAIVADTSSAGSGVAAFMPFRTTEDLYVIAKQTGTGSASGKVSAIPLYVYEGT